MTVAVAVPWRPTPSRLAAHTRVVTLWRTAGYEVVEADSDPTAPFSRAQAKNDAVRAAGTDVVILADADTIVDPAVVARAVTAAAAGDALVYPYDRYVAVPAAAVDLPDLATATPRYTIPGANDYIAGGGALAISASLYWWLGGMDEEFGSRWGGEDVAFLAVADTLAKVVRLPGTVYAIDHNGVDRTPANRKRTQRYLNARGDKDAMRRLIDAHVKSRAPRGDPAS